MKRTLLPDAQPETTRVRLRQTESHRSSAGREIPVEGADLGLS